MIDLSRFDLVPYQIFLAVVGVLLAIWLIGLSNHSRIGADEKTCFRIANRFAYALIGAAMGWTLIYGWDKGWQPWPPFLVLMIVVDLKMGVSVLTAYFPRTWNLPFWPYRRATIKD